MFSVRALTETWTQHVSKIDNVEADMTCPKLIMCQDCVLTNFSGDWT